MWDFHSREGLYFPHVPLFCMYRMATCQMCVYYVVLDRTKIVSCKHDPLHYSPFSCASYSQAMLSSLPSLSKCISVGARTPSLITLTNVTILVRHIGLSSNCFLMFSGRRYDLNPRALVPTVREEAAAEPRRLKGRACFSHGNPMWDPHVGRGLNFSQIPLPYLYGIRMSYVCEIYKQ